MSRLIQRRRRTVRRRTVRRRTLGRITPKGPVRKPSGRLGRRPITTRRRSFTHRARRIGRRPRPKRR